jgi:hypothetical protein
VDSAIYVADWWHHPRTLQHPSIVVIPALLFLSMAAGGLTAIILKAQSTQQKKLDLVRPSVSHGGGLTNDARTSPLHLMNTTI